MTIRDAALPLLCLLSAAPAVAGGEAFGDLREFFTALRGQPAMSIPLGTPVGEDELTPIKGAPVSQGLHCDLIERPGDRALHVCRYRCDGLGGIITRPAERIPGGRGAAERPDCYRAVVTPRR